MALIRKIAAYQILGLPTAAVFGIITLLLFLIVAYIGMMVMKGKSNVSVAVHMNLARIAIAVAFFHALLALSLFV